MVSTVFFVLLPALSAMRTDTESCLELPLLYDFCVANDAPVCVCVGGGRPDETDRDRVGIKTYITKVLTCP